jgi:plastocyanin
MKQLARLTPILIAAIISACAQPAAPDASMAKPTEAMMAKPTDAAMAKPTEAAMAKTPDTMTKGDSMMPKLPDQLFAAHFVDSAPKQGDTFAKVPDKVLINFNFTLGDPSAITVLKDDKAIQVKTVLASNNLSMSAALPSDAGDGLYVVKYKACWPDKSCHDGVFAFVVDSKKKSSYFDMIGKKEVIADEGRAFNPALLIVSKGTKVTWVNDDSFVHFINTDPHPSHNNLPALNTLEIKKARAFPSLFPTQANGHIIAASMCPMAWSVTCSLWMADIDWKLERYP